MIEDTNFYQIFIIQKSLIVVYTVATLGNSVIFI